MAAAPLNGRNSNCMPTPQLALHEKPGQRAGVVGGGAGGVVEGAAGGVHGLYCRRACAENVLPPDSLLSAATVASADQCNMQRPIPPCISIPALASATRIGKWPEGLDRRRAHRYAGEHVPHSCHAAAKMRATKDHPSAAARTGC
eukprot:352803-Chlamydomonas_euryale.AAC.3